MLHINLQTPKEVRFGIAARAKAQRLALNISQKELAERSGVSLGSVKRFETSGLVSLSALLEIALVLGRLDEFGRLFAEPEEPASLFAPEPKKRQRSGRRKV
ncbi:Helix-turn-helix domain protein [uncultured delta proteobacterium]|uniref:Helix-turn-helix domain protein n=1 Tax=uncultured delta proteobacterium TaxID=34034 RepID=A0A212KH75_9DELT|nr:Helix-turn-helix domain protein [uncultured delta proteobacterium]